MLMLKLGLMLGGIAFLWVGWASWSAGYPVEIAAVRGILACMAMCAVGYVGELIVSSAPHAGAAAQQAPEQAPAPHATEPGAAPRSLASGELRGLPAPILGAPSEPERAELEPAA